MKAEAATPRHWRIAREISGWLTRREADFLFDAARALPAGATVVEIGSFLGRSTVCLALGLEAGRGGRLVSVDPHIGSPKHEHLLRCADTLPPFRRNLRRAGVEDRVRVLHMTSVDAAARVAEPIDLLFVDGAHERDAVAADVGAWLPKVRPGGVIAFHDSWHMSGVHRVTAGSLLAGRHLARPRLVDTITAAEVVERVPNTQRLRNTAFVVRRAALGWLGFLRLTYRGTVLRPVDGEADLHSK